MILRNFEIDDAEIDDVDHGCFGDEYNNLIDNNFKCRLRDVDLHLSEFENQKLGPTDIVNHYLEKKRDIDVDDVIDVV